MHGDTEDASTIKIGDRSFLIDHDATASSGWFFRESYRDGWPVRQAFPTPAAPLPRAVSITMGTGPLPRSWAVSATPSASGRPRSSTIKSG